MEKSEEKLLNALREAKSSEQVSSLIPQFQQAVKDSTLLQDQLENSLEDAIFESPEVRKKLHDQAAAAKTNFEDLLRGLRVAERRLKDLQAAEFEHFIDKHSIEAREINRLLREDYCNIHDLALQLSDRLNQAKARKKALHFKNTLFAAHKRPDLKVIPILSLLARHLNVTTDMLGTGSAQYVHDPIEEFALPEYYPRKADKWQPRLAHLKEVEV